MQISHNKDLNKSNHILKMVLRQVENSNRKQQPVFTKMKIKLLLFFFNQIYIIIQTKRFLRQERIPQIKIKIKMNKNKSFLFRHQNMLQVKQLLLYIWLYDGPFDEWFFLICYTPLQVFLCAGEGCTDNDTNVLHYYHIGLAFLTGFLFATHLPERLAPGSFDYIGAQKLKSMFGSALISLTEATFCAPHRCFFKSMQQVGTRSDSDEFLDKPFRRNSFLKV